MELLIDAEMKCSKALKHQWSFTECCNWPLVWTWHDRHTCSLSQICSEEVMMLRQGSLRWTCRCSWINWKLRALRTRSSVLLLTWQASACRGEKYEEVLRTRKVRAIAMEVFRWWRHQPQRCDWICMRPAEYRIDIVRGIIKRKHYANH